MKNIHTPKLRRHYKAVCILCGSRCFTFYLNINIRCRKSICEICKQTIKNKSFEKYIRIIQHKKVLKRKKNRLILKLNDGLFVSRDREVPSFTFSGCAWGCIYYTGVYEAIHSLYTSDQLSRVRWCGISSGSFFALAGAMRKTPEEINQLYDEISELGRLYGVWGKISIYYEVVLRKWLPKGGDEYRLLNKRLFVGVTRLVSQFEWIDTWSSNMAVRDAIHAASHIPFYAQHIASVNGHWAIDGGFSNNYAMIDKNTVMIGVGPLKVDVSPTISLCHSDCHWPPSTMRCDEIRVRGKNDFSKWHSHHLVNPMIRIDSTRSGRYVNTLACTIAWVMRALEGVHWSHMSLVFFLIWLYRKKKTFKYFYSKYYCIINKKNLK